MSRLVILAGTFTVGCVVGCGSPTKQFESFIAKADAALKADKTLKSDHKFSPVAYDVRKTDSTVSPYVAEVTVAGVNIPALAEKQVRLYAEFSNGLDSAAIALQQIAGFDEATAKKLIQEAKTRISATPSSGATAEAKAFQKAWEAHTDDGRRTYRFNYAYQDGRWVLKDASSETSNLELKVSGVPKAIQGYFTP